MDSQSGIDRKKEMFSEFFNDKDGGKKKGGDEGAKEKEEKEVVEEDPLWTTHLYDKGMAELGFGGGKKTGVPREEKKDKKGKREKKEKKSSAVKDFEAIDKAC